MATYSFKSVGKTREQQEEEAVTVTKTPFGIKTPLQLGSIDGVLEMNYGLADQFADNLRNLLLTNWGEHLGIYDFGANLRPLVTEFVSQKNFDNEAIGRIQRAVGRWMPFVDLEDFTSSVDYRENNGKTAIIRVTVTYNIPALEVNKRAVQIVLYAI